MKSFYGESADCEFCGTSQRLIMKPDTIRPVFARTSCIEQRDRTVVCCVVCLDTLESWIKLENKFQLNVPAVTKSRKQTTLTVKTLPTQKPKGRPKSKIIAIDLSSSSSNDENIDANNVDDIVNDPLLFNPSDLEDQATRDTLMIKKRQRITYQPGCIDSDEMHDPLYTGAEDMYSSVKKRRSASITSSILQRVSLRDLSEVRSETDITTNDRPSVSRKSPRLVPFKTYASTPIIESNLDQPFSPPDKYAVKTFVPMTRITLLSDDMSLNQEHLAKRAKTVENNNIVSYYDRMMQLHNLKECTVQLSYLPEDQQPQREVQTKSGRKGRGKKIFDPSPPIRKVQQRQIKLKLPPKRKSAVKRGKNAKKFEAAQESNGQDLSTEHFQSCDDLEAPSQEANVNSTTFQSAFDERISELAVSIDSDT